MKILLTGRNGQVGGELEWALAPLGDVVATDRSTLDLGNEEEIRSVVRAAKPNVIVNAAAYTAVDKAESEPELAMRINGFAPGVLGEEAKRLGALLVHYSTDYVFDGEKTAPYVEEDEPNPLNGYGASKLAGERAVAATGCRHLILRTSWVYGVRGNNFLLTMIRIAREGRELRVVEDQLGTPTWAGSIAKATADILARPRQRDAEGLFNLAAAGDASWFAFASEIFRQIGWPTRVVPISTSEYPTVARRPRYSVLDSSKVWKAFGIRIPNWTDDLARVLKASAPL